MLNLNPSSAYLEIRKTVEFPVHTSICVYVCRRYHARICGESRETIRRSSLAQHGLICRELSVCRPSYRPAYLNAL